MIDIKSGQKSTAIDDVVWSATTDVIAHFLERISYLGAFVAASSTFHGPTLYVPTDASDVNNQKKIKDSHEYTVLKGSWGSLARWQFMGHWGGASSQI